ncbi:hypothetical protein [Bacillus cereus]|uniref:hypothetical protein n=1 Tax=Bacillus cereus TaxID=1396 RepID=UPI002100634B|nr:hypothetical protein [Bacillus cereus]
MNAQSVKDYLKEDLQRVEKLLEEVGCHGMWRTGDEIRCAPPDSTSHTAIAVNIDTMYCCWYKQDDTFRGDILSLVQLLRKEPFTESFRFVRGLFGLGGSFKKEDKKDLLAVYKGIRKQHRVIENINEIEVPKFGMETLRDFIILPHMSLFYEGITPQTQELFKVGYDPVLDRILFPHFNYDDKNAVVGITGRTTLDKKILKEMKIPKYFNYIKGYKKMYNLYGFSHSLPFIIRDGILFVYEAEKSVQKEFSMTRNEGHGVSTGGHEISEVQIQLILQNTPIDVEIVFAYDKDIMTMKNDDGEDIGEAFLINTCKRISKYRKTSYIWDDKNLLDEKSAPVDHGVKTWNYLLENRRTV